MRPTLFLRTALAFLIGAAGVMHGQQQIAFPFQILVTTPTTSNLVANGASIAFLAEIGQSQTAHIIATYQGTGTVQISQLPVLFGSPSFTVTVAGTIASGQLPATLRPGDNISFDAVFKPSSTLQVSAQLVQSFIETVPTSVGLQPIQGSITLNLIGTAPSFAFSYALQSDQNVTPVQPGGDITFPATLINTTAQAQFNITNIGSGAGQIKDVTLVSGGPAFKLQSKPLFPQTLGANQNLPMLLVYNPTVIGNDTGQIQVTYGSGTTVTFNLKGSGTSSSFTYQVIQSDGTATTVSPNGTITLPDTAMGSTNSVIIKVQNTGNALGAVNSVNLTGQGFQLSVLSPTLPTLKPNESFTFSINFTPLQPGPLKGQLAIGADLFNLAGQGLGPQLGFSYISSAGTITLNNTTNPSVVFTPMPVTQSEQLTFMVNNKGTLPATVSNLSIGETKSPFSISGQPALPITLNPGDSFQFNVAFAPLIVGFTQGTLRIDTTVVPLTGSGTPPPALPKYTFQGPSGSIAAQTQPGIGLKLSDVYPVALAGTLTLSTSGNLPSDNAVQFATGGRTVPFIIPANSTNANFAGTGTQAFLQTGTVAEAITLTPSFTTQAGGVDITPDSPPTVQLTVPPSAPALLGVQVATATANGFTLNVLGYSTTRKLTSANVTFSPATGFNVPSAQFPVDLSPVAPIWFQSASAQSFGGQFEIAIPFSLQGTVPAGQTLLQALASVTVSVTNDIGTSNSILTRLQ